jgi:hypothetical protein
MRKIITYENVFIPLILKCKYKAEIIPIKFISSKKSNHIFNEIKELSFSKKLIKI